MANDDHVAQSGAVGGSDLLGLVLDQITCCDGRVARKDAYTPFGDHMVMLGCEAAGSTFLYRTGGRHARERLQCDSTNRY